jgi:hypothetical protein
MTLSSPTAVSPPLNQTVADRPETVVGGEATFLDKVDANERRIFVKFEKVEFN